MKKIKHSFINKNYKLLLICTFLLIGFIYLLLIFKNPYSNRSLIPNLEPYPDTLYYSNPAWNFSHGNGFIMKSFDYNSKIETPPLYSLYLIPFFAVFKDVRSYYFANLLLGFLSVSIFMMIIKKIYAKQDLSSILLIFFGGFIFITNFFIFTLPSLLMAENITLILFLLSLYLLLINSSKFSNILAGLMGFGLLLIKFSNLPLAFAFYLLWIRKLYINKEPIKTWKQFTISLFCSAIVFGSYIYISHILVGHKNLSSSAGFSTAYFFTNLNLYLHILFGSSGNFLWYNVRFFTLPFILIAILGIFTGFMIKTIKSATGQIVIFILFLLLFMSFFYSMDMRYISPILPLLFILIINVFYAIKIHTNTLILLCVILVIAFIYLFLPQFGYIPGEANMTMLKKQVSLNLKYKEEPWNYEAVELFNNYFTHQNKRTYLATFLSPYFVNYYSNGNYNYLPIAANQEFYKDKIQSNSDYQNSPYKYYQRLLKDGDQIYISPYYQNNLPASWEPAYANLVKHFKITKVKDGCINTCNIYKLTL